MGEVWGQNSGTQRPGRLGSKGRAAEVEGVLLVSGGPEGAHGGAPSEGRAGEFCVAPSGVAGTDGARMEGAADLEARRAGHGVL